MPMVCENNITQNPTTKYSNQCMQMGNNTSNSFSLHVEEEGGTLVIPPQSLEINSIKDKNIVNSYTQTTLGSPSPPDPITSKIHLVLYAKEDCQVIENLEPGIKQIPLKNLLKPTRHSKHHPG